MAAINFGTIATQNGRTVASGLSSGLDSTAIIDAILAGKQVNVTKIEDEVSLNSSKLSLLSSFKVKLDSFKNAANALRKPPGFNNDASNGFEYRTASVTSTSATNEVFLTASASPGALVNSYSITNIDLAKAHTLRRDGFTSKTDSVVGGGLDFSAGSFTLNGESITLEEGDSLVEIRAKVNAVSANSKVSADIIQVSSSSFSLVLKSTLTGADNDIDEFTLGVPPAGTIQFGADVEAFDQIDAAEDLTFELDGLAITRSSNKVSDVIEDVTLSFVKDTAVETSTVEIDNDTTTAQNAIIDFLNAYNDLKTFIAVQTEIDSSTGKLAETAILGDEPILREILNTVTNELTALVSGITGSTKPKTIFNLGIDFTDFPGDEETTPVANIFELDSDKLSSLLASSFDNVRQVFEFTFTANSSNLSIFNRSNNNTMTAFQLDIDSSRTKVDQVRVLDSDGNFLFNATLNGTSIKGEKGTLLEGYTFVYTGDGTDVIDVSLTQGIADRVYNAMDSILKADTGVLDTTVLNITDENKDLNERIEELNNTIEAEREALVAKYSALEAAISRFNNILRFLEAQRNANDSR